MTSTPNMGLILPIPTETDDLTASEMLITALERIDSHTHENSQGVKIPSAGLNINGTVDANDEGFTNTKFVKLTNLTTEQSELTLALYAKNGDLIFRNSTNEEIALTTGTSVGGSIQGSEYGQSGSRLEYVKGDETDGTYTFYDGDTSLGNIEAKDIEANDIDVVDITAETLTLTTDLTVANGGTGASSLTDHGVMLGSGTDAVSVTAVGSTGNVLLGNTDADPSFGKVGLTTHISGILPLANGGSGSAVLGPVLTDIPVSGFLDRDESTISFNDSTLVFTITPVGANFNYYYNSAKYTKESAESITLDDIDGLHYIYYNGGTLSKTTTFNINLIKSYTLVAIVMIANSASIMMADERHGCDMSPDTHAYLHTTIGFALKTGGGIGDITVNGDGSSSDHVRFSIEASTAYDEDINVSHSAKATTDSLPMYYKDGSVWVKSDTDKSVILGSTRAAYNKNTLGVWSKKDVANNSYVLTHVFMYNDAVRKFGMIMGQTNYLTETEARSGAFTEIASLVLDESLAPEVKFLGTIINHSNDSFSNSVKSRIISTASDESYVDLRSINKNDYATLATPIPIGKGGTGSTNVIEAGAKLGIRGTTLINGFDISINANPAKIDIAAGEGVVVDVQSDPTNPVPHYVSYNGTTALTLTYLALAPLTVISIDKNGTIYQDYAVTDPNSFMRERIILGVVYHLNNTSINAIENNSSNGSGYNLNLNLADLSIAVGCINFSGNLFSANGANLNINKTEGVVYSSGGNIKSSLVKPNNVTIPSATPATLTYGYQNGAGGFTYAVPTTSVNPNQYDNGTGTLATVDNNKYTIQRIWVTKAQTFVQYGQTQYSSMAEALDGTREEVFNANPLFTQACFRCWLIVKKGITVLNVPTTAKFVNAGKFGLEMATGGATTNTTSLQQAYNNSTTPEIVVDSTRGALTVRDAVVATGANLLEIEDNASAIKFAVDASGIKVNSAEWTNANHTHAGATTGGTISHTDLASKGTNTHAEIDTFIASKGAASGLCPLGADSKIASTYLPSYVDDVAEYANFASFPVTGEASKIYVDLDTNKVYRWSGTAYVEVSQGVQLGETSTTAYRGDRGKTAYDHTLSTSNPHSTKVENLSDVNITDASVEDGQAIVWDDASGKWVAGASGDASFKVSYLSGSTLTVKAGGIKKGDAEYRTYAGTNTETGLTAANLAVTPTVSASASYYLYIDTSAAVAAGLLTSDIGRKYYGVTNAMFMSSLLTPSEVDTTRYIPIGIYTTDASSNIVSTKVGNVAPRSVDSWSNIKLYEDKIVARYKTAVAQTLTASASTLIDFDTADTSSSYVTTGAGWKFTAPRNGMYHVSTSILIASASWTVGRYWQLSIYKNGSLLTTINRNEITTTNSDYYTANGDTDVYLVTGDYVDVRIYHDDVSNKTLHTNNANNYISIHEITNYPTSAIATPTNTPFAILTANPTPVTTGCVSGYERVLVDSSIHDQMNCEAFYWDASDTNASWEKKTDAPMMVHNGFIAMLSSYIDALDWATGDKLKVIAGNGARITAIPYEEYEAQTTLDYGGTGAYIKYKIVKLQDMVTLTGKYYTGSTSPTNSVLTSTSNAIPSNFRPQGAILTLHFLDTSSDRQGYVKVETNGSILLINRKFVNATDVITEYNFASGAVEYFSLSWVLTSF